MSSLKSALAGLKEAQQPEPKQIEDTGKSANSLQISQAVEQKPRMARAAKTTPPLQVKPIGPKSSNPDFMQLKVYVRRKTKVAAARKWEDAGGLDMSELIETLLLKYLSS